MLRNKFMTACSVALLTAAVYGCSSSSDDGANMKVQDLQDQIAALSAELGEGEELTPEALAALIQAKVDADAALADAMIAHQAALDQAAMDAETAKQAALDQAAMDAETAKQAALDQAAMDAETAKQAALDQAAMDAETAKQAALDQAAMDAMIAHQAALDQAATDAAADKQAALDQAAMDAADMALADKTEALRLAAEQADADEAEALAAAKVIADAAQVDALAAAKVIADAAQVDALAAAKVIADAAQVDALAAAKVIADAAQEDALDAAKVIADAAQEDALDAAKVDADAALKVVQDELDVANARVAEIEEEAAGLLAANAAERASNMAKAVLGAIGENTPVTPADPVNASPATVKVSSAGVLTATQAGYTMSAAPEEIDGWRGRTLENDEDTTVIYANIEDAKATEIGNIYDSSSAPGEPDVYSVHATVNEGTNTYDIPWSAAKRTDDKSSTTGAAETAKTTFAGSVRGLAGAFSCTGATNCTPPVPNANTGAVTSGGTWTFVPRVADGTIDVPDSDYLSFGWWLNPLGTKVEQGFEVDTFAMASGYLDSEDNARGALVGTLEGSATYTGGAAGKWAIASTTEDRTDGGHFTATATLGVNFDANSADAGDTPTKLGVSVSGMITRFMTGDVSRPDWSVALSYDVTPGDATDGYETTVPAVIADNATTVWSTGGAVDGTGTWEATFHGEEDDTMHPMAVVGTFNAAIAPSGDTAVGRIQGAFGATN